MPGTKSRSDEGQPAVVAPADAAVHERAVVVEPHHADVAHLLRVSCACVRARARARVYVCVYARGLVCARARACSCVRLCVCARAHSVRASARVCPSGWTSRILKHAASSKQTMAHLAVFRA